MIKTTIDNKAHLATYLIPSLPLSIDLETKTILKHLNDARAALGELKGIAETVPNQDILINTLSLQEAKDSSEIENIITTHDELYRAEVTAQQFQSTASKEVSRYAQALRRGYIRVKESGLITNNFIKEVQRNLEENDAGFRSQTGTILKNEQTGAVVYTPPQELSQIESHMKNLEAFINEEELCEWDPLIKMAIIHHQFESIHPFYDGNGRTGRIINILYLVKLGLLGRPILYLSRYINKNKSHYYACLQKVRDDGGSVESWEQWVKFMLKGVQESSKEAITIIIKIKGLMQEVKHEMRTKHPKIYSQDLLNHLFRHPYTRIDYAKEELHLHRNTVTKYLDALTPTILEKHKIGKENYYINRSLFELLSGI